MHRSGVIYRVNITRLERYVCRDKGGRYRIEFGQIVTRDPTKIRVRAGKCEKIVDILPESRAEIVKSLDIPQPSLALRPVRLVRPTMQTSDNVTDAGTNGRIVRCLQADHETRPSQEQRSVVVHRRHSLQILDGLP